MRYDTIWLLIPMLLCWQTAKGKSLNVVATTPDIAWLASEILKEDGSVTTLLGGHEDAHAVDAVPSYILAAAKADVFCFVGMSLEIGWVPKVIEKTANRKIQPGSDGYCDMGKVIEALDVPKGPINRSMGDVHPEGNPHYYASLPQMLKVAEAMAAQLMALVDSKTLPRLESNLNELQNSIRNTHTKLKAKLEDHFGKELPTIAQYHGNFTYFANSYGFKMFGNIEETPGVAPSAGAIARGALSARKKKVAVVLAVPHNPRSLIEKFAQIAKIPAIIHSDMAQPSRDSIKNPLLVQQSLVDKIIESVPRKTRPASP